jgi:hypothetical protein
MSFFQPVVQVPATVIKSWNVGFSGFSGSGDYSGFSGDANVTTQPGCNYVSMVPTLDAYVSFSGVYNGYSGYSGWGFAKPSDVFLPSGQKFETAVEGATKIVITSATSGNGSLRGTEFKI